MLSGVETDDAAMLLAKSKATHPMSQAGQVARSPAVKPHLGGINWRLVMKHSKQPAVQRSEEKSAMVTVEKSAPAAPSKIGHWEIFDEKRLRQVRVHYLLAFAAGILLATLVCYGIFIVPMSDKIAQLEGRESELIKVVENFETQTNHLSNILDNLETKINHAQPAVVSGARLSTRPRAGAAVASDDSRKYYDTAIDTGY